MHKFFQRRERGALIINADYNPPDRPKEFAIDYLTFDDLQKSYDKTLQSSVISYDPTLQVIVFIFLPSKSGNSVAIWRRKLVVPNNARLRFQTELDVALAGLKEPQSYIVYVDEYGDYPLAFYNLTLLSQSAQKEERFTRYTHAARGNKAEEEAQMVANFQIQILMFMSYLMDVFSSLLSMACLLGMLLLDITICNLCIVGFTVTFKLTPLWIILTARVLQLPFCPHRLL